MIIRKLQNSLLIAAQKFPVVKVFGPRESGKSNLVKMTFPNKPYFTLENSDIYIEAETDPVGFLNNLPEGAIIDEIQRLPLLMLYLKETVDKRCVFGPFIFTSSYESDLCQTIWPSKIKDIGLIPLLPLSLAELRQYQRIWDPFELIVKGTFPCVHEHHLDPSIFYNKHLKICVDRDIRALINLKDVNSFNQFIRLTARQIGQVLNYTSLSKEVGVSATTIKNWILALKACFIIFELPPFTEGIPKRLVKTSKIYFYDTGLAASLLGIQTPEQAKQDILCEKLYENLVVTEILKSYRNTGQQPKFFFYRDTHDNNIDLIVRHGNGLIPVEIDSANIFKHELLKNIEHFRKIAGGRCTNGFVLYNGYEDSTVNGNRVFNLINNQN